MHRVLSFMATTVKVKCNVNFIFLQDTAAGLVVFIAFVCVLMIMLHLCTMLSGCCGGPSGTICPHRVCLCLS